MESVRRVEPKQKRGRGKRKGKGKGREKSTHIAVPTIPGAYAFTVILYSAISMAYACVRPRTAHLDAL